MQGGVGVAIPGFGQVLARIDEQIMVMVFELHIAVKIDCHLALVGQAHGPLVAEAHVQAQMRAHAPACALQLEVVVGPLHGRPACGGGNFIAHVHAGVEGLHAHGHGKDIVDLVGQGGHKGNGLHAHVIQIVSAGPVAGIAVAQAEAREHAHAQPDIVVELIAGIAVRGQPDRRFGGGVLHARGVLGADGMRARQLGDARRIVGQGRDVVGAAHHAARQGNAPGAPFIEGETLGQNR